MRKTGVGRPSVVLGVRVSLHALVSVGSVFVSSSVRSTTRLIMVSRLIPGVVSHCNPVTWSWQQRSVAVRHVMHAVGVMTTLLVLVVPMNMLMVEHPTHGVTVGCMSTMTK